ncbi:MAG: polysaccharide deacetylase family protein [Rhodospirillaceae bacterium]|jgi:allantoinase|nr:polysaccharide deacetylase family protein [Rhodospirillaceae bacterium]
MATPEFSWPHDMRLAVSVVVNVEEGAEESIADGDRAPEPVDELQVVMSKGRNFGNESNYDYGIRAGAPRVLNLLRDYGVTATFTAAALALERAPDLAKQIVADGHEICAHGYRWAHQHWMKEDMERDFIRKAAESIDKTCGKRPAGWLSRYVLTENTRRLLVEEGYTYHMDDYSDDVPRWDIVDEKPILISPYALDTNDMKMWMDASYTPDQWEKYLIDTFDWLYAECAESPNKMMSLGVHLRIVGRPGRMKAFENFLAHAAARDKVWFATRQEIADAYAAQVPAPV